MIGITSYGGYVPRLRLDRMAAYESMGWFAPAIVMVAQGERSFCNWDEDSLTMAVAASRDCLRGVDRATVDGVTLCSTTLPFADRSNATVVQTALGLRADVKTQDLTSTQRVGTTGLVGALDTLKGGESKRILVTATDARQARTAYFYELWFGDGAASLLVGEGDDVVAEHLGSYSVSYDFVDHYRGRLNQFDYVWEERWARDQGYSKIIPEAVEGLLAKLDLGIDDVDTLVFPCLFKAEHKKIAAKLGIEPGKVVGNLHEECGETGAAHPLVMLVHALEDASPGDRILVCGFGQGCDALLFRVTDAIGSLTERQGIRGCLADKEIVRNHQKFLKFRDLIEVERGIRAEAPTQTAMSVLWRKRDMLLGLVGGRCTECGTAQFPRMDICVNPACRAHKTQEPYAFADRTAEVKSFTGDLLAVSVDPPAVYGMIQFEGGGRMMADFTSCRFEDLWVGRPVTMAFRRRYRDEERGFSGYFWKAVPAPAERPVEKAKDELRFDGQVAVVTGAGAGLGRTYALELGRRGAKVVVNDLGGARDGQGDGATSPADAVVAEIEAAGGEAVASYDSVSTAEGGQAIVDRALEAFGRIDVVVNNAGILRDRSFAKLEASDWHAVLGVHLHGAYNVTRPAFIQMKEQGYGRIVLTTSAAGLFGNFGQTNYGAAKAALVGLMNTLEIEGRKAGILVNTVAPLATTRLTDDLLPANLQDKLAPELVMPMVVYLASSACEESGGVFAAGMSYFARIGIVGGSGAVVGDGDIPTPEDVKKGWDAIDSLAKPEEYQDAMGALGPMLAALSGKKPGGEEEEDTGGGGGSAVAEVFDGMVDAFQADAAAGVDVTFQYHIGGEGGGDWYSTIRDGTCEVEAGVHDAPTTTIRMDAEDFVALIHGQLNAMLAYTSGKLKIEGDLMKSQLIEKLFRF